jgi:hypothetical protein
MNILLKPLITKIYNINNNNQYIINDNIYSLDETQYIISNNIDDKFNIIKFKLDDIENNFIKIKDELSYNKNKIEIITKINKYIILWIIFNIIIIIIISIYKQNMKY